MVGITSDAVNVRARIETESGDLANLSVAPPEAETDAATKQYVDEHVPEDVVTNSVLEEKLDEIVGQDGFTIKHSTFTLDYIAVEGDLTATPVDLPSITENDIVVVIGRAQAVPTNESTTTASATMFVNVGSNLILSTELAMPIDKTADTLKEGASLVFTGKSGTSGKVHFAFSSDSSTGPNKIKAYVDVYTISPGVISTQAEENKTLRQEMEQLKQEMQDLQQQFTVLNSSVTAIVASAVEDAVSTLNTQLETLKSQYDTLNTEYEKTKETVSTLESSSSDYSSQISGLTTSLETAEGDITNLKGAGYQTSEEVEAAITAKGYQTADQVNTAITGKGYQTASQVETAITGKGYQTAAQVQTKIESYGYRTSAQVESAITSKGYITQATADGRYVNVGGDTMTGALNLPAPTAAANAATKEYLDAAEARVKALV